MWYKSVCVRLGIVLSCFNVPFLKQLTVGKSLYLGTAFSAILNEMSCLRSSTAGAQSTSHSRQSSWHTWRGRHGHLMKAGGPLTHKQRTPHRNVGGKFIPKHRFVAGWNNPGSSLALFHSTLRQWHLTTIENTNTRAHTHSSCELVCSGLFYLVKLSSTVTSAW